MNFLIHWTRTPAAQALGWTLFHFLWEGVVIAAVLAVVLLFLRAARLRYIAACLALGATLIACAATFVRVRPDQPAAAPVPVLLLSRAPAGSLPPVEPRPFRAEDLLPWAAPVWLAGVLLLHLRTVAAWIGVRRLRRFAAPAPSLWRDRLATLAAGVRLAIPVDLLESCRVDVPVVIGYLRPAILVPVGLLAGMSADDLEAILLHELAHIRRRDYLVNLLQTVAENLLFYHPAVWWISGVIRAERENCCDDLVVAVRGDAHRYAAALAALETRRLTGEPALAATGGDLMKRIHRLLDRPAPPHAAFTPALSAGLVLLTAAVALSAWQPAPQPQPSPQQTLAAAPSPRPLQEKERVRREAASQSVGSPYQKWLNEDVAYIIEDRERAAFKALTTDEEREHFIEQFWTRRDPTPGTVENEFKEEHYRRIAYTNQKFAAPTGLPGWKTDRGRVYITYGPPDEIESHPTGDAVTPYPFEQWRYRFIQGIGENVIVEFEDQGRNGWYRMTTDPQVAPAKEAVVAHDAVWMDTVKRGDMQVARVVRGTVMENGLIAATPPAHDGIQPGQVGVIMLSMGKETASARVARLEGDVVFLQLDGPAPAGAKPGDRVDAKIDIETARDVVYVGRPAVAAPNSAGAVYKLDPDGRTATLVGVRFGRVSINRVEVVSGLAPGDRIILNDMRAYHRFPKIEIK